MVQLKKFVFQDSLRGGGESGGEGGGRGGGSKTIGGSANPWMEKMHHLP